MSLRLRNSIRFPPAIQFAFQFRIGTHIAISILQLGPQYPWLGPTIRNAHFIGPFNYIGRNWLWQFNSCHVRCRSRLPQRACCLKVTLLERILTRPDDIREPQIQRRKPMQRIAFGAVLVAMLAASGTVLAQAPSWTPPPENQRCPSKWGAGDERGSANHMKPQTVLNAVKLIKT